MQFFTTSLAIIDNILFCTTSLANIDNMQFCTTSLAIIDNIQFWTTSLANILIICNFSELVLLSLIICNFEQLVLLTFIICNFAQLLWSGLVGLLWTIYLVAFTHFTIIPTQVELRQFEQHFYLWQLSIINRMHLSVMWQFTYMKQLNFPIVAMEK